MNEETTASRVNRLLQKSRQAFRIYSSMSKSAKAEHNEFADMQAIEWRNINAELIRQLTHVIEKFSTKNLALQIARMRDVLLADYRRVEAELNAEHRETVSCAQRGDFIRVAQLSRLLISKKAFVQAAQAASHELSLIIDDKNVNSKGDSEIRQESFIRGGQALQERYSVNNGQLDSAVISDPFVMNTAEKLSDTDIKEELIAAPRRAKVIPLRR